MFNIRMYYKENLNSFKIITMNIKQGEQVQIIILSLTVIVLMLVCLFNLNWYTALIMLSIELLGLRIISRIINKSFYRNEYCKSKKDIKFGIDVDALTEIRVNLIADKLDSMNLLENNTLDLLLANAEYEEYSKKYDYFLVKGFVVAIIVSLFNIICSYQLDNVPKEKFGESLGEIIYLFIICSFSIFLIENFIKELYESLVNSEEIISQKLKRIIKTALLNKIIKENSNRN